VNDFPGKTKLVHGAGVQVFNEYITFLDQFGKDFLAVRGCGIQGKRFFIGIEL
jgi:hypothetical protein